jgi:hypothetical protein
MKHNLVGVSCLLTAMSLVSVNPSANAADSNSKSATRLSD